MKKKYILALTFLCLLMGQSSFAQDYDMDGGELDIVCIGCDHVGEDGWWQYETSQTFEQLASVTVTRTPSYNSTTAMNYSILVNSINASNPNRYVVYEYNTGQYVVLSSSTDQSSQVRSWYYDYDGDGYSSIGGSLESESSPGYYWKDRTYGQDCDDYDASITNECYTTFFEDKDNDGYGAAGISSKRNITSPDIGWREGTSLGTDCDDNNPLKTTDCTLCTTTCGTGFILNSDCECVKKPCDKAKVADHIYNTLNGIQEAGKTELNDYGNVHLVSPAGLPSEFNNFKWSDSNTGFSSALYSVDHGNGNIELVYATQGTNPLDLQDWVNNGQQALGQVSAQYTQSVNNAVVLAKWAHDNGYTLSFTGHSLGGGLANANALATGLPATIYNPAGLSNGTISNDPRLNLSNSSNVTAYIVRGEPVDYLNIKLGTPVRGTRNYIGSPQDSNSLYGTLSNLTIAGLISNVQLHMMSSVLSNIDCND